MSAMPTVFTAAVFLLLLVALWPGSSCVWAALGPQRFSTARPVRGVVLGGSITAHPANFGKFLARGCSNLELVNYGKARLTAKALHSRFQQRILADKVLMAQLSQRGKDSGKASGKVSGKGQKPWLIYLGGLNGVYAPERTRGNIRKTFRLAHERGFRIMALTLPPWGSLRDRRFFGFDGLFLMRATQLVNDFIRGVPTARWDALDRPEITIDIYASKLRDKRAVLRDRAGLASAFSRSRYKRRKSARRKLIRQAATVPRMFMKKTYRGWYHFHPNARGHRVIAHLICQQAPVQWGCDCPRIARSWSKAGRIYP